MGRVGRPGPSGDRSDERTPSARASEQRAVLVGVLAALLIAATVVAGSLSLATAAPRVQAAGAPVVVPGATVAELVPAPPVPARVVPGFPLRADEPEPVDVAPADRCDDPAWWNARGAGDPSDYVAACGTWPYWVDRGATACMPGELGCPVAPSAGPGVPTHTGPTEGRPWSPEYGYFDGRTDGPRNSDGEPCMQGRDNHDPDC
ncbi:hypothetical protein [Pseudonocardia sp. NPDC046786]|uniref:hypothetical protein n=1 Tax=Pseudonocardia sp. NPDC046786 TaxID=3155471 RepID=UPI0033E9CD30